MIVILLNLHVTLLKNEKKISTSPLILKDDWQFWRKIDNHIVLSEIHEYDIILHLFTLL